ncbi:MAG: SDR family NAD(P)-dependent oxidoreductase [Pseudomonadales bacterium]|nr:SDR family NAD(P)-dependent oxidoreductase [Halioglobus sp.]MCP5129675.1 SDR family NAD(P)-dependent oxidoreductase [Pseudomonadales bacterium]
MKTFTAADVPDQTGKTIFITGANTGLGFEAAKVLAGKGARVIIGCRSNDKARQAKTNILAAYPNADIATVALDLASLASVKKAAATVAKEPRLDVLINNAGIMIPPYELTRDGFESQFGVNHLGPFALTSLLLDKLGETPDARVVSTASIAHKQGRIHFDDINAERGYNRIARYAQSKIANLYFAYELQRRLSAAGASTISVAAHPGIADTELSRYLPQALMLLAPLFRPLFNTPAEGAWPTLMAATAPGVQGGEYYGPSKRNETAGPAIRVKSNRRSHDDEVAARLWELSIEMTGIDPKI